MPRPDPRHDFCRWCKRYVGMAPARKRRAKNWYVRWDRKTVAQRDIKERTQE